MSTFARNILGGGLKSDTLPADLSFEGETVLITGATSGLGLEATVHYLQHGASVTITARTAAKGEQAKLDIESRTGKLVDVMILDMDTFEGVKTFVNTFKKENRHFDIILLNCGVQEFVWKPSPEGWFANIQVNVLSTTLLGLLLIQWMRSKPEQSHLLFVGSGSHWENDLSKWPRKDIITFWSKEENFMSGRDAYGISKLMLHYCVNAMDKIASAGGKISPIVNTVCPGIVQTGIARSFGGGVWGMQCVAKAYMALALKAVPADVGARSLVVAAKTTPEQHGTFRRPYLTDDEYEKVSAPFFKTEEAKEIQAEVWKEVVEILAAADPEVSKIVL
ncbi:NAD(P)-binding protein [Mollisia scopiformis]|uniref:NAD(P)-binding protein n=1 Tax=Mollisia scopiformis TaxID=149040 RepID=A0A132B215_MOLSC|nr:NAD(P)-binding protein [Mollisia scopiformis]KUJ06422.1 NAD(P)-binding protein [Mollisia scopiformis]